MTPPFKPGDRVTVRYNKPLGVLTVETCEKLPKGLDGFYWYVVAARKTATFAGPATSLKRAEENDG